jgi:hypothetical protein
VDPASTIVTDACAIAKARGMTSFGGRFLQSTLNDLALHRNLKVLMTSAPINFTANGNGPFSLPLDYRRPYDLVYQVQGYQYEMDEISLEIYDLLFKNSSIANYPTKFATDLSGYAANPVTAALMFIYPQSNSALTATLRYFKKIAEMTAPLETNQNIPWFEDQEYLRVDCARQLMQITDDERYQSFTTESERLLEKHLLTEGDEQRLTKNIRLDPNKFNFGGKVAPTKISPF